MIPEGLVRTRLRQLRTHVGRVGNEQKNKAVWREKEEGVRFEAVKFARRAERKLGDYTGVKVKLRGKINATREAAEDFIRAMGDPNKEKLTLFRKKPKVLIWKDPKFD